MGPTEVTAILEECRGGEFEQAERYIDGLGLGARDKTMLWLLAWAELPSEERLMVLLAPRLCV